MPADSDNDVPSLPADTLKLLEQFNTEKDASVKRFEDLKAQAESDFVANDGSVTMDLFGEDWNASQFWYTDDTANKLAEQLLEGADGETAIALISAPSAYVAARNMIAKLPRDRRPRLVLLEFDERFSVFGSDFVQYDFQQPLRVPPELTGKFHRILCDPPFLSEDCQTKTALTVRKLAKNWQDNSVGKDSLRVMLCTGERMEAIIVKLYARVGLRTTTFDPEHRKGLSNEFRCYANFCSPIWEWR